MAKRVRGSTSRPGQRAPLQKSSTRPPTKAPVAAVSATAPSAELTDAEEARAAVLEAAIVAEEREHEATNQRARTARSAESRGGSALDISAAAEYAYVARDVRRIAIVGGSLVAILLGLWVIVSVTGFSLLSHG